MTGFPSIPGSPFLLDHLLGLLFIVHILFMNYVVAAPLIIAWYALVKGESGRTRAQWMSNALPVAFTFTINFGVACLLLVQVLFSKQFFTANILLGNLWLSVIGLLLVSFYGAYLLSRLLAKANVPVRLCGVLAVAVGAMTWAVGVIMIMNYFVTASPSHWNECVLSLEPVTRNPVFLPRSLHFAGGSLAVTGFWMMWMSWWRSRRDDPAEVEKLGRQGLQLATAATGFQIMAGIWQLVSLPVEHWDKLFSGSFVSVVWISGVAMGLLLFASLITATLLPHIKKWRTVSSILLVLTLFGMVAGRDLIRHTSFGKDFDLRSLPAVTQTGAMTAFAVILLIGILLLCLIGFFLYRLRQQGSSTEKI